MSAFRLLLILSLSLMFSAARPAHAQADDAACPALVDLAMRVAVESCAGLAPLSACYASPAAWTEPAAALSSPADRTDLLTLARVQTTAFDPDNTLYGVVLLHLQADIPAGGPEQVVKLLMLGDVVLTNAVDADEASLPAAPVRVVVTSAQRVNLRAAPSRTAEIIALADPRELLQVDGRDASGDWLRVVREDEPAWIAASLTAVSPDDRARFDALPVVGAGGLTPMQAFYAVTGFSLSGCPAAPDLLLIQTPAETPATLTINGVTVRIDGSVALLSSSTFLGDLLAFGVMEDALAEAGVPDDTRCLHTRMAVMDGAVTLDEMTRLPLGHLSEQVTCLDDDDAPVYRSAWAIPVRLPRDAIDFFAVVERVPGELLHRPLRLPGDGDITLALAEPTSPPPAATSPPRPTTVPGAPTAVPATPNPAAPTAPPAPPTQPPSDQPDCSTFRPTSPAPGGLVAFGPYTFFWDGARNVQAYQLAITPLEAGVAGAQQLYRTGANNTSFTLDLAVNFPSADAIRWYVQALVGTEPNFTAVCDTAVTQNPLAR